MPMAAAPLVFASGATLNFSSAKSMTATAYTAGHGGADNYTATGTAVRVGTVAVDKNVTPLGTRMFIVTSDRHRIRHGLWPRIRAYAARR